MKHSLYDLYNELTYVGLQIHEDAAAKQPLTKQDITLSVNGIEVKLPTTERVVELLHLAVGEAAINPNMAAPERVRDLRNHMTMIVADALEHNFDVKLPPLMVIFDGRLATLEMTPHVFTSTTTLLDGVNKK